MLSHLPHGPRHLLVLLLHVVQQCVAVHQLPLGLEVALVDLV